MTIIVVISTPDLTDKSRLGQEWSKNQISTTHATTMQLLQLSIIRALTPDERGAIAPPSQ